MTSAGGPNVLGAYAVSHLVVRTKVDTNGGTRELMRSPFDDGGTENNLSRTPPGWMRDGVRTRMAFMVKIGSEPSRAALAIVDNDIGGHVQWNTLKDQSPAVSPGEHLVIEWDEMYSVGKGTPAQVSYENLAPGNYRFYVHQLTIMGLPTGKIYALSVEIPFSFWKTPWFWVALTTVVLALALGSWRYREWRQLEAENTRLGQQQALERERFRIAQDIHDDLGARVTQISLASAMSERKAADPEVAREGFRNITQMARELVTSLYDTIWVVNPENDSLEAVGHYLCQMANQLVSQAGLPCRLEVPELPSGIPVSSHQRHNMSMAVKEAIHNAIKHAAATQVHLKIELTDSELMITIRDDGAGFDPAEAKRGSGLDNIHARLREIGGQADLSSAPHQETIVRLRLPLSVLNTVPTCGDTGSTTKDPASKLRAKSSNRF
jgi:signal transduction histidine kinase